MRGIIGEEKAHISIYILGIGILLIHYPGRTNVAILVATSPCKRASLLADIFPHWSDTMTTTANYFYRENPDSTIDSICPRCFQTIASGQILDELKGVEEEHRCSSLEELHRQYVDSERSIF
jgi:hypothetical protein